MKMNGVIVCMDKLLAFKEAEAKEQLDMERQIMSRKYGFCRMLVHWTLRYHLLKSESEQENQRLKEELQE